MDEVLPGKIASAINPLAFNRVFSDSVFSGSVTEPILKAVN